MFSLQSALTDQRSGQAVSARMALRVEMQMQKFEKNVCVQFLALKVFWKSPLRLRTSFGAFFALTIFF